MYALPFCVRLLQRQQMQRFDANGYNNYPPMFTFFHGCTRCSTLDIYVRGWELLLKSEGMRFFSYFLGVLTIFLI